MSGPQQPPSAPNPRAPAAVETAGGPGPPDGSQPGTSPTPDDDILMKMQRDFLGHRIWREILPGRIRYVARRIQPGPGPHTVVTPDLRELATALAPARQPATPPRRQARHD